MVAASLADDDADTHWLRSDFDQFLAREVASMGIPYFERASIDTLTACGAGWELSGVANSSPRDVGDIGDTAGPLGEPIRIRADFVLDASGDGGFLAKQLGIGLHPAGMSTRSRSLFSHFTGVAKWQDVYAARGCIMSLTGGGCGCCHSIMG